MEVPFKNIYKGHGFTIELKEILKSEAPINRIKGVLLTCFWLVKADAHTTVPKKAVENCIREQYAKIALECRGLDTRINHIFKYDEYELMREIVHEKAKGAKNIYR